MLDCWRCFERAPATGGARNFPDSTDRYFAIKGSPMPTLGCALLDALRDHGAREIFGIPGDFVLPFFKVIEESGTVPGRLAATACGSAPVANWPPPSKPRTPRAHGFSSSK